MKMAKGLPKSIIKKYGISKKAWSVFRGRKRKTSRTRKGNPTRRKGVRRLTRRKRKRRSRQMTVPLAPVIGVAAGLASGSPWSGGNSVISRLMEGNIDDAAKIAAYHYLGIDTYNGTFHIEGLKTGVLPLVLGALVHKFVGGSPLNINRMLARAKIPFIRI